MTLTESITVMVKDNMVRCSKCGAHNEDTARNARLLAQKHAAWHRDQGEDAAAITF